MRGPPFFAPPAPGGWKIALPRAQALRLQLGQRHIFARVAPLPGGCRRSRAGGFFTEEIH